jgi:NitT/TauT family transport system substrate-binding protein
MNNLFAQPCLILGTALLAISIFVSALTDAAAQTKITVGQSFVNPAAAPFWVAKELGLFAKHGLDVTIVQISGSTQAIQGLIAGEFQFMLGAPSQGLTSVAAGADLLSIATLGPQMPYLFITKPEIRSPAELKGKILGVSGAGLSTSRVALLIALKHFGLDARRDNITLLITGTEPQRAQALAAGKIDATVLDPLYRARAEHLGLNFLHDLSKIDIPWDHDVILLTRQFAKNNPGAVEALLKAVVEANAFILNPANKKTVMPILAKQLKLDKDEDIELAHSLTTTLYVVKKPYPSLKAAKALVDAVRSEFPQLAQVNLENHIDTSYLKKLDESGFIDQLYLKK